MSPPRAEPQNVPNAVARVRAHLRRRAALAAVLWIASSVGLALTAAWWLAGPEGWRQGSPVPLVLDMSVLVIVAGLVGWLRRGERSWLAENRVARSMEGAAGLGAGAVEGALQLARGVPPGVSGSLAVLAERSVAGRLELPSERLSGGLGVRARGWVRRAAVAAALLAPVVTLLALAAPARSLNAWAGLGRPLRTLARARVPALEISPGDAEVLRGSEVSVIVRAPGRTEVTLRWRREGDVARSETVPAERGEARFRLPAVSAAVAYSATTPDGAASETYHILPVDPLLVSEVSIELAFPPHTNRAPEAYQREVPPLVVPVGTRIAIAGLTTRPLSEAALERAEDGLLVPIDAEGTSFAATWSPRVGGRYAWRFRDTDGGDAELLPTPIDLTVVPDSAPAIRFAFPAVDMVLPTTLQQPLVVEVRDDYGLSAMEIVAYRVNSAGERSAPVLRRTELVGTRAALARPIMDLRDWGLQPGDTVRYFARALDNAPSPSATQTREYVLRMPELSELRRNAQEEMEEMAVRLQQLVERVRRAGEESRDLEREAAARADPSSRSATLPGGRPEPNPAGFEQREQLRQALEQQQAMSEEAQAAREELEAIAEALREAGAADAGLQRELEELQRLLAEAASTELRERLDQLASGLEPTDARDARRTLEQLAQEQERFRELLQESLEQLRRAAVEQDFRATAAEARELGQQERALAAAMREGSDRELRAEQQRDLLAGTNELQERLDELARRLSELEEERARAAVQAAQRETSEGARAMDEAQQLMQQETRTPRQGAQPDPEAADRAEQAGQALERAANELEQAQDQMSSKRFQAVQRALEEAAEDALSLARGQADIRREMRDAGPTRLAGLRGDEAAVLQGLRNLAANLEAQAGGQAPALRAAGEDIGRAMLAIERTLTVLEERRSSLPSPESAAQSAIEALNQVALTAIAVGEQSGGQQGGSRSITDRLDELAEQQGELNNRARQLLPMQLGAQALGQQAEELSMGQEDVASELDALAQQPGAEGQALGSLEALAQEARRLAEQLAGGRLDPETRERQERLFHRLLDAGRTLESEDLSDERQSRTPPELERGEVLPLGPEALGVLRYGLPSAEQLQQLSPTERELVLRYFDRLNRLSVEAPDEEPGPAASAGASQGTGGPP